MGSRVQKPEFFCRKLWKKAIILLSVSVHAPHALGEDPPIRLKVGLIEFFPLVIFEKDKPHGLLLDFAMNIFKKANVDPDFRQMSINRSLEELKINKLDMVLTLFKTEERQEFVRFTKDPLLVAEVGICTLLDLNHSALTSNMRLVHVQGTILPATLQKLKLFPINSEKVQIRMLQMLIKNRIDAIYSPLPEVIHFAARDLKFKQPLHCYHIKNESMPIYFGFSAKIDPLLFNKIEKVLQKSIQEEDFDQFLQKKLLKAGITYPPVGVYNASNIQ